MDVIRFENVSKTFRHRGGAQLLRSHLHNRMKRDLETFYALKNVTFNVQRGQSVAVVGRNGAGKSTLLSLISGLCPPTAGRVMVKGRVAALLELGSGFHMDLTGAENVALNAAMLGLSRHRTVQVFDDILAFSGVGQFINDPLRTYSSGMIMRLAFSVAVHVDADILIIDEVLAVGDQAFQAKCFEKIFDFKRLGKTLFFVSHNSSLVQGLCDRALWLDQGELIQEGRADEVVRAYLGHSMTTV